MTTRLDELNALVINFLFVLVLQEVNSRRSSGALILLALSVYSQMGVSRLVNIYEYAFKVRASDVGNSVALRASC